MLYTTFNLTDINFIPICISKKKENRCLGPIQSNAIELLFDLSWKRPETRCAFAQHKKRLKDVLNNKVRMGAIWYSAIILTFIVQRQKEHASIIYCFFAHQSNKWCFGFWGTTWSQNLCWTVTSSAFFRALLGVGTPVLSSFRPWNFFKKSSPIPRSVWDLAAYGPVFLMLKLIKFKSLDSRHFTCRTKPLMPDWSCSKELPDAI